MRIIDVDFKKKRVNFTYDTALRKQQVEAIAPKMADLLVDIQKLTKDAIYIDWVRNLFKNILRNLRDE